MSRLKNLIDHFSKMIDPQYFIANEYCFNSGSMFYTVKILIKNLLPNSENAFMVCREFWDFDFVNVKLSQEKIAFVFEDKKNTDEVLAEAAKYRLECRNYLMSVDPSELTPEDTLEHLGYGRNGLGS